ncbi:MAG: hypothetical protein ACPG7R_07010, partial [Planctomycetota bacterium]
SGEPTNTNNMATAITLLNFVISTPFQGRFGDHLHRWVARMEESVSFSLQDRKSGGFCFF